MQHNQTQLREMEISRKDATVQKYLFFPTCLTLILVMLLNLMGLLVPPTLAAPHQAPTPTVTLITNTLVTKKDELCQASYVIQSGDIISKISQRFYGDAKLFNLILDATNLAAENDSEYNPVANIDNLKIGQRLCIPDSDETSILRHDEENNILEVDEIDRVIIPTPTPVLNPSMVILIEKITDFPTEKGILFVENFSPSEITIDLIGPNSQTQQIPTEGSYSFVLDPGIHKFNAHAPLAVVTLPPGTLEIKKDQIIHLVTFAHNYEQSMLNRAELNFAKTSAPHPTRATASFFSSNSPTSAITITSVVTSTNRPTATSIATAPQSSPTRTPITRVATPTRPKATTTPASSGNSALAPPTGFSRVYMQNYFSESVEIRIANQTITIAPDGLKSVALDPGRYPFTVSISTGTGDGQLNLTANTSWVIRLKKDGGLGWIQVYP
ncbi:LysM peptidoglycan-binding domain-containing protein [Anaerolineales bacterium HSG24]|nr:LysM peptidoglycan-binding domain-containing protein [Anaerolineales bacterium HSG24]